MAPKPKVGSGILPWISWNIIPISGVVAIKHIKAIKQAIQNQSKSLTDKGCPLAIAGSCLKLLDLNKTFITQATKIFCFLKFISIYSFNNV